MKQIERYIFGRITALTLWSLSSITILALTTQVLLRVDVLTTSSSAIFTFFSLAATLIPEVVLVIAPFALLVGIGRILTTMNDDSELVVIEASGASNTVVARPVIIFSVLIAIMMLFVANIVGPRANRALYSILANANSDILSIAVTSGQFQRLEDDLYIQIKESLPGGELGGIFLSDRRDPKSELIYYAKSGIVHKTETSDLLLMNEGEVHRANYDDGQVSIINFSSYALDLQTFIPATEKADFRPRELFLFDLINPDTTNSNYEVYKRFYPYEIHSRLSFWLYPIAFGLVMVIFLGRAQSHRSEQFQRMATAVIICLIIRIAGNIAAEQTKTSSLAAIFTYAVPMVSILYLSVIIMLGKSITLPKFWLRFIDAMQKASKYRFRRGGAVSDQEEYVDLEPKINVPHSNSQAQSDNLNFNTTLKPFETSGEGRS